MLFVLLRAKKKYSLDVTIQKVANLELQKSPCRKKKKSSVVLATLEFEKKKVPQKCSPKSSPTRTSSLFTSTSPSTPSHTGSPHPSFRSSSNPSAVVPSPSARFNLSSTWSNSAAASSSGTSPITTQDLPR